MKMKKIEYDIALVNGGKQSRKTVSGYALDMLPRVCVRQEVFGGWVVDDYDTGFSVNRSFCFLRTKDAAIEWVLTALLDLVASGKYAKKQREAVRIMKEGGLLK